MNGRRKSWSGAGVVAGALLVVVMVGMLTACATPFDKCGTPYTPEEDRAGVEHPCPKHGDSNVG